MRVHLLNFAISFLIILHFGVTAVYAGEVKVVAMQISADDLREKLVLKDPSGKAFRRCNPYIEDGTALRQELTNESVTGAFQEGSYRIEWGDGAVEDALNYADVSAKIHTYLDYGIYTLKFSGKSVVDGAWITREYPVMNLGNPAIGLGATEKTVSCIGGKALFEVTGLEKNTPGTMYIISYGDGIRDSLTIAELRAKLGVVEHVYNKSYCEDPNREGEYFTFKVTARNECELFDFKSGAHSVVQPPTAKFEVSELHCTGVPLDVVNGTDPGTNENCKTEATYTWNFGDGTSSGDRYPQHTYADSGTYKIMLTVQNGPECSKRTDVHIVRAITKAEADFELDPESKSICAGDIITFTNKSVGDNLVIAYGVHPDIGVVEVENNHQRIRLRLDSCGTYWGLISAKNACSGDSMRYQDIRVSKDPLVTLEKLDSICPGVVLDLNETMVKYAWYCNVPNVTWEIENTTGTTVRDFVDGTGVNSLYPRLTFGSPGVYNVRAKLPGTGCLQTEVIATQKIVVHDSTFVRDIQPDKNEICFNNRVHFVSHSTGEKLTYEWELPFGAPCHFVNNTSKKSPSPEILFPQYSPKDAPFVIKAHLKTVCKEWHPEFEILVKKNPEVTLVLDTATCPGSFDFASGTPAYVEYQWYNNEPIANWKITSLTSGTEQTFVTPHPVVDFKKAEVYRIDVRLESANCPGEDKLSDTKDLRIWNDSMTLKVLLRGESIICEGEAVSFTNTSDAYERDQLKYLWTVTPATGWDYLIGNQEYKEPKFKFTDYGDYAVTTSVHTFCGHKDTTFNIVVVKDPEVELRELPNLCLLDTLTLDTTYIQYQWNNNKPLAEWQITSGNGGMARFVDGTDINSLHPKVVFDKKGEFSLAVSLAPSLAQASKICGGDVTRRQNFTVYDTAIAGNIVIDGGKHDICEEDVVAFKNTTSMEGAATIYHWEVKPLTGSVDGADFTDNTDAVSTEAKFKFTHYGEYQVLTSISGTCNNRTDTFNIKVRGVPEVDFKPLADICNHTTLEIIPEKISYVPKDCDLTYNWSLSPADGYSFDPVMGNTTAHPAIAFTTHRSYQVTLELTGQCGGPIDYIQPINVLNTDLEALSSSSVAEGCTDLAIDFGNTSVGDALTYHWSITPATDWEFTTGDAASEKPSIKITKDGNYVVTLAIENICGNHTSQPLPIRAYSVPVIKADGIQGVCEKDFMFIGKDRITIDENNDTVTSVQWTVTPVGFTWKNGETEHSQKPDITFKNGTYQLKGEYRNACPTAGVVEITVVVDSFIPIAPSLIDLKYCHYDPKDLLKAAPESGVWSSASPGMVENDGGTDYYFNPRQWGDFEVIYHYTHLSCIARDTINVHVDPLPEVYAGPDQEICINNDPRALMETPGIIPVPNPASWWEGRGEADDIFTPDVFGARPLYYWYLEPATGCRNVDSLTMMVWGLPDTTFRANAQYCVLTDAHFTPVELGVGNRFDWTFGDGHSDTTYDAAGVHRYEDFGYVGVSMIATSVHGCKDTSGVTTVEIVNTPPPAVFTLDSDKGCGPHELNISLDSMAYTDKNLLFTWNFGNGVLSDSLMPPNPQTYEAGVWDTTYVIHFGVYNLACADRPVMDKEITVYSSPDAQFVAMHKWECSPMDVKLKNNSTGNKSTYVWHFGDGETSLDFNPTHLFTTDTITRVFDIMLIATNQCDVDTFVYPLIVKPQTLTAFFQTPKRDICVGEEICFTNHSSDSSLYIINKQWNFGDNSGDTTWNACHAYDGDGHYQVHLFIDNGCGFDTISDYIIVHPLPVLTIQSEDYLCENDTFHFEMSSDLALQRQEWDLGDSTISINRFVQHRYKGHGFRTVKVQGISSSIGFCKGTAEKVVEIYPNPVITILPLDTAACGEMLYKPDISGVGFLMWDYGDGSDLTSATEHFYENPTDEVIYRNLAVYAESDKKCKSDYKGLITLYNVPRAGIDRKILKQGKPQQVEFINLSEMYDDCVWHLPFNKIVHSFDNQVMEFDRNGYYEASVVAANRYGCSDSASIVHQVLMKGLFFPNTFIPHSESQAVNRFNGVALGLKEYHLMILDPYGNKVWETNELENGAPVGGWDGCNVDGKQMPQGVYIWRARALFLDEEVWTGKNNDSGTEQTVQGTVMLLRK